MFNKKGIVSLNLFVLLLLLFLMLFGFSYFYKDFSQKQHIRDVSLAEITQSGLSLRSFFTRMVVFENQTHTYDFIYENEEIVAVLNSSQIRIEKQIEGENLEKSFSMFNVSFCSTYEISVVQENSFYYNGTCIVKQ